MGLEMRQKLSEAWVRRKLRGDGQHTEETKLKISLKKKGKPISSYPHMYKGKRHHWFGRNASGDKNPSWKGGSEFWKKDNKRNDPAYQAWRMKVWMRDNFKCRIVNDDCEGRIEAHHILGWTKFVELRYEINNGITLCHAHHPRKRAEEKRLIPVFQGMVSVSR